MECLIFLVGLSHSSDVEKLGSRDFRERHAAYGRLYDSGVWAYPALIYGMKSECQERRLRCGDLVDRIDGLWYERMMLATFRLPEGKILDDFSKYFSENDREFDLASAADKYNLYEGHGNPFRWVRPLWATGTKHGDVKVLIIRCADNIRKRESNGLKFDGTDPKDQTGKP